MNAFFIVLWASTSGLGTYPWFLAPMAGWGIGVMAHFVGVFAGESCVQRATQREYQRMRDRDT